MKLRANCLSVVTFSECWNGTKEPELLLHFGSAKQLLLFLLLTHLVTLVFLHIENVAVI